MTEPGKMTEIDGLDALFAQVRAQDPQPGDRLLARIMTDAIQTDQQRGRLARATQTPQVPPGRRSQNRLAGLFAALGGWPALGGLAMATVAGVWIGVAQPASFTAIGSAVWGETVTVSLDDAVDLFGLEG